MKCEFRTSINMGCVVTLVYENSPNSTQEVNKFHNFELSSMSRLIYILSNHHTPECMMTQKKNQLLKYNSLSALILNFHFIVVTGGSDHALPAIGALFQDLYHVTLLQIQLVFVLMPVREHNTVPGNTQSCVFVPCPGSRT